MKKRVALNNFQKVELLRKRLPNDNPPSVPDGFKEMFTSFLNLKRVSILLYTPINQSIILLYTYKTSC